MQRSVGAADGQYYRVTSVRSAPMSAKPCTSLTLTPSMYSMVSTRFEVRLGTACREVSIRCYASLGLGRLLVCDHLRLSDAAGLATLVAGVITVMTVVLVAAPEVQHWQAAACSRRAARLPACHKLTFGTATSPATLQRGLERFASHRAMLPASCSKSSSCGASVQ